MAYDDLRLKVLSMESLQNVLVRDVPQVAASALALGVIFHATILRTLEVEDHLYRLLTLGFLFSISLVPLHVLVGCSIPSAVTRTALITSSYTAGIFLSIATYRLFFHRLRKFPGPFGAKISKLYSASLAARDCQYHKQLETMHQKYGDFIRTGPRELCVVRKSAVAAIYGPNTLCRKSSWYTQVDADYRNCSINMTRNVDDYRRRRRNWDRGFSMKILNTYEPRVRAMCDQFIAQLDKSQQAVDGTAWSMYLSFDIMGEVGFGQDFGGVSKGQEHPAIKGVHDHMNVLGIASHVPWLLNLASRIPGATAGYAPFFKWCASQIKAKQKAWVPGQEPDDIVSWLVKAFEEKDVSASPSEAALHEDSRVVVIAGSETTATTLAQILFYLAKYPQVYRKLQKEVESKMPTPADWSYELTKSVTYIDDIINEALRLKPALLSGGQRLTPPQGLEIDGQFIPGNTTVLPTQLIQTDGRYWKQASDFIPERFGDRRAEMETDGAPFFPFTLGLHACPGKNLALMSLRIAISKIAQHFDLTFAEGETGEGFDIGAQETFTTTLSPLMLNFTHRRSGSC